MDAGERQRLIDSRKEDRNRTERLWVRDDWRDFKVWQIPVEGLLLNVDNRRFAAERKLIEEMLGHSLDPENNPDDEVSVISILLDKGHRLDGNQIVGTPGKDYEALRLDWITRKQEKPFWIRPDGLVRNGNRRLAMLKRFQQDQGVEGFEFAEAIFLESDIDEQALFEMEQREQLTTDFKVKYTDINLLLTLRDAAFAHGIDWADRESLEITAGKIQHVAGEDKAMAVVQLQAIRAMDDYLADSGETGQYQKLRGQVERFRDVGKIMARIEEEYPDDAPDMMRLLFASVRAGVTNYEIRVLRKIFTEDHERYENLLSSIEEAEKEWEQETEHHLNNPDLETDVDDVDEDEETAGPVVPKYPSDEVKRIIRNANYGYTASTGLDVLSSLDQALSNLDAITDDRERLSAALQTEADQEIRVLLERVIAWADSVKPLLTSDE